MINSLKKFIALALIPIGACGQNDLDIKIGQMIMVGIPSVIPDSATLKNIQDRKIGALLLFEKNIAPTNSSITLKRMIKTYQKEASIPLIVAIDQEGGKVNRLKEKYGFPNTVSAKTMGESIDTTKLYSKIIASTLLDLGINTNLAPVVDIAVNPKNPVIVKAERAFSANENDVFRHAKEFIRAHRKMGIITVLKHFPGHGSSETDTHLGIADVTATWIEKELMPYKKLISSGDVEAIMTAHIINRNLDKSGSPATLSENILNGLLREKMHYDGVIISDDMQMHAIEKHFSFKESIRLCINAGADILVFSNNIGDSKEHTADKVHRTIGQLVAEGKISEERIDQSFQRIIALKERIGKSEY